MRSARPIGSRSSSIPAGSSWIRFQDPSWGGATTGRISGSPPGAGRGSKERPFLPEAWPKGRPSREERPGVPVAIRRTLLSGAAAPTRRPDDDSRGAIRREATWADRLSNSPFDASARWVWRTRERPGGDRRPAGRRVPGTGAPARRGTGWDVRGDPVGDRGLESSRARWSSPLTGRATDPAIAGRAFRSSRERASGVSVRSGSATHSGSGASPAQDQEGPGRSSPWSDGRTDTSQPAGSSVTAASEGPRRHSGVSAGSSNKIVPDRGPFPGATGPMAAAPADSWPAVRGRLRGVPDPEPSRSRSWPVEDPGCPSPGALVPGV